MTPSKVYLTTAANGPILGLQPRELPRNDPRPKPKAVCSIGHRRWRACSVLESACLTAS